MSSEISSISLADTPYHLGGRGWGLRLTTMGCGLLETRVFLVAMIFFWALSLEAQEVKPWGRLIWADVPADKRWEEGAGPDVSLRSTILPPTNTPASMPFPTGIFLGQQQAATRSSARMHPSIDNTGLGLLAGTGPGLVVPVPGKGSVQAHGSLQLFRGQPDGSVQRFALPEAPAGSGFFYPAFSPDGRAAYFSKLKPGVDGLDIALFSLNIPGAISSGAQPEALAIKGTYPAVSPDGKYLAWVETAEDRRTQRIAVSKIENLTISAPPHVLEISAPDYRRIVRPSWRSDSGALVFSCDWPSDWASTDSNLDTYADSWTIWATAFPRGTDKISVQDCVALSNHGKDSHAIWPSFSSDGRYVAYSAKETKTDRYKVYVREVNLALDSSVGSGPQQVAAGNGDALWVSWIQDVIPPSLRVELVPTDTSQTNVVKVLPGEAIANSGEHLSAKAQVTARGPHFSKTMKPSAAGSTETPAALSFDVDRPPVSVSVDLTKDIPYEKASGKIAALTVLADGSSPIQGFYVNENVRILVKVSAKDNLFLRAYPGATAPNPADPKTLEVDENPRFFQDGDLRALSPGFRPPYLPRVARADAEKLAPGVSWWWEDASYGVLDSGINSTEFVPRSSNFSGDEKEARKRMVWFHAMAIDLWQNKTEIVIPIFVYPTSFTVDRLSSGVTRKR